MQGIYLCTFRRHVWRRSTATLVIVMTHGIVLMNCGSPNVPKDIFQVSIYTHFDAVFGVIRFATSIIIHSIKYLEKDHT